MILAPAATSQAAADPPYELFLIRLSDLLFCRPRLPKSDIVREDALPDTPRWGVDSIEHEARVLPARILDADVRRSERDVTRVLASCSIFCVSAPHLERTER